MKRHTGWTGALGDDTDLIPERDVGQLSPKKRAVNQTRKLEDAGTDLSLRIVLLCFIMISSKELSCL